MLYIDICSEGELIAMKGNEIVIAEVYNEIRGDKPAYESLVHKKTAYRHIKRTWFQSRNHDSNKRAT